MFVVFLHDYINNSLKFEVNFLSCMTMCGTSLTTIVNCIFNYQTMHIQLGIPPP
jgi:hypothetical protein